MKIKPNVYYANKTIFYKIMYALKYRVKYKDATYTNLKMNVKNVQIIFIFLKEYVYKDKQISVYNMKIIKIVFYAKMTMEQHLILMVIKYVLK